MHSFKSGSKKRMRVVIPPLQGKSHGKIGVIMQGQLENNSNNISMIIVMKCACIIIIYILTQTMINNLCCTAETKRVV